LALPAGQLADRVPRRLVFAGSLALYAGVAVCLVVVTRAGASELWPFLALAATSGVAAAIGNPASRAPPPALVPTELLSSAVALLPLFARSVLHTGPAGLGVLRSAPAVGGILAAGILTQRPLGRHVGRTLLVVVALFGASMVVFGLSRSFAVSLVALAVSGF